MQNWYFCVGQLSLKELQNKGAVTARDPAYRGCCSKALHKGAAQERDLIKKTVDERDSKHRLFLKVHLKMNLVLKWAPSKDLISTYHVKVQHNQTLQKHHSYCHRIKFHQYCSNWQLVCWPLESSVRNSSQSIINHELSFQITSSFKGQSLNYDLNLEDLHVLVEEKSLLVYMIYQ